MEIAGRTLRAAVFHADFREGKPTLLAGYVAVSDADVGDGNIAALQLLDSVLDIDGFSGADLAEIASCPNSRRQGRPHDEATISLQPEQKF